MASTPPIHEDGALSFCTPPGHMISLPPSPSQCATAAALAQFIKGCDHGVDEDGVWMITEQVAEGSMNALGLFESNTQSAGATPLNRALTLPSPFDLPVVARGYDELTADFGLKFMPQLHAFASAGLSPLSPDLPNGTGVSTAQNTRARERSDEGLLTACNVPIPGPPAPLVRHTHPIGAYLVHPQMPPPTQQLYFVADVLAPDASFSLENARATPRMSGLRPLVYGAQYLQSAAAMHMHYPPPPEAYGGSYAAQPSQIKRPDPSAAQGPQDLTSGFQAYSASSHSYASICSWARARHPSSDSSGSAKSSYLAGVEPPAQGILLEFQVDVQASLHTTAPTSVVPPAALAKEKKRAVPTGTRPKVLQNGYPETPPGRASVESLIADARPNWKYQNHYPCEIAGCQDPKIYGGGSSASRSAARSHARGRYPVPPRHYLTPIGGVEVEVTAIEGPEQKRRRVEMRWAVAKFPTQTAQTFGPRILGGERGDITSVTDKHHSHPNAVDV
ncbi:hypothetical protein DFH09DRAFT_1089524 [Mycena vulgaris]|nr:hypothetical protein DFH09DRAFT_1089524 [Mycena vulgaris]